jgi:hypothetical protein
MSELEDRIGRILSSPEDMARIMEMARSLSAGGAVSGGPSPPEAAAPPVPEGFGTPDPRITGIVSRVMAEFSSPARGDKAAVLASLRPYIKKERWAELDRAAQIARLARVARTALGEFSGGRGDV